MDNKIVALIIVILLIVVGAAYVLGTQNSNTPALTINNTTNSSNTVNTEKITDTTKKATNTTNSTPKTNITAQQAISLVEQNGQAAGEPITVKATNPRLIKVAGVYYWKVTYDGGPMYVNANTGEVNALL